MNYRLRFPPSLNKTKKNPICHLCGRFDAGRIICSCACDGTNWAKGDLPYKFN